MADWQIDSGVTIERVGSQYLLAGFPVLGLPDQDRAVKYFSLNPFLPDQHNRCPIECAYCVCHQDSDWHHEPERFAQHAAPADLTDRLLDLILNSSEGQRGFPISLCDYSDPFIPAHRDRVLGIVQHLIDRDAHNLVYITTKVHPGMRYLRQLQATLGQPHALRPTVFVSLPPLKPGYEQASLKGRVRLLKDLVALGIPCCWYMRPLVEEWYDESLLFELARELLPHVAHHVILSGVVMSHEVETILRERDLLVPAWNTAQPGRKQNLAPRFEQRIRTILAQVAEEQQVQMGAVMGHRLCGTNGNHAYGCLLCAKQDRHCQLFQTERYGTTIEAVDNQRLKLLLHAQQNERRAAQLEPALELLPVERECR